MVSSFDSIVDIIKAFLDSYKKLDHSICAFTEANNRYEWNRVRLVHSQEEYDKFVESENRWDEQRERLNNDISDNRKSYSSLFNQLYSILPKDLVICMKNEDSAEKRIEVIDSFSVLAIHIGQYSYYLNGNMKFCS